MCICVNTDLTGSRVFNKNAVLYISIYSSECLSERSLTLHSPSIRLRYMTHINLQACRGYEIIHPYPYPYPQIFRGYPWIYPYPQTRDAHPV